MKQLSLLPLLALMMVCFSAHAAKADPVVLTSGTAFTAGGFGTVNLVGTNFSLNYFGEIPPGATTTIQMNTVTAGSGFVSFNGLSSSIFIGSLSFSNSFVTGQVSAYSTMDDLFLGNPASFTVNFVGDGFVTITPLQIGSRTQFTVSAPEPMSLLMFITGLGGLAALKRKRSALKNDS